MSPSCSPSLPCHLLACCILSCHHVHCIIMFSKLASVRVPQFRLSSVLSPDTFARARGMSEILFYKWPENVLGMGMKVGVRCFYAVGRPPVNFCRIRSSFDAPTDNYSGNIVGLTSNVFGLQKPVPGCPLFSSHRTPRPSLPLLASGTARSRSEGSESPKTLLTLAPTLFKPLPCHFGRALASPNPQPQLPLPPRDLRRLPPQIPPPATSSAPLGAMPLVAPPQPPAAANRGLPCRPRSPWPPPPSPPIFLLLGLLQFQFRPV